MSQICLALRRLCEVRRRSGLAAWMAEQRSETAHLTFTHLRLRPLPVQQHTPPPYFYRQVRLTHHLSAVVQGAA